MKRNIGNLDRIIRIAIGLVLVGLALMGSIGWWGCLGINPLLAGVVGNCPVYILLGISTCKRKV